MGLLGILTAYLAAGAGCFVFALACCAVGGGLSPRNDPGARDRQALPERRDVVGVVHLGEGQ